MSIYVTIGNSDNKLTQREWAHFVDEVRSTVRGYADEIHIAAYSPSDAPWQNAIWGFTLDGPAREAQAAGLKRELRDLARKFRQDSIAWVEGPLLLLHPQDNGVEFMVGFGEGAFPVQLGNDFTIGNVRYTGEKA